MSSFWNSPAWSMVKRPQSALVKKQRNISPGPGNYDATSDIGRKTHGWKMGTSFRNKDLINNVPGPGKYSSSYQNQGPKITMGTKPKNSSKDQNIPGPGNYNANEKSIYKSHTGFSMGAKYGTHKQSGTEPGPGSYNLECNTRSGVKIGTSTREYQKGKQFIPGPGTYSNQGRPQTAGPYFSFGGGQKKSFGKNETVPGPGQYNYQSSISQSKGVTLGQKFNHSMGMLSTIPGPGQYENILKRPSSGTKIGKAQRNLISKSFVPGPGAYDCQYVKKKGFIKIGSSLRHRIDKSDTPGPGSYQINHFQKGGVTISSIKNKKNIEITPGPGAYDPQSQGPIIRPYSAKIGTGSRSKAQLSYTPGPGAYNLESNDGCKFAYSKQNRSKQLNLKDPGPGQYNIPPTIPSVPYYQKYLKQNN